MLVLLVHGSHTLSTFFSIPGLCSPLILELAPCSRALYLKMIIMRRSLFIIQAFMGHLLCWALQKRQTRWRLPLPSWGSHSCQGIHPGRVITNINLNVALEHASGPDNVAQAITEDPQKKMTFLLGHERQIRATQLLRKSWEVSLRLEYWEKLDTVQGTKNIFEHL